MDESKPKDLYSRMVEMAFHAAVPGATAHDRLRYLKQLMKAHGLQITDALETPPSGPGKGGTVRLIKDQ